MLYPVVDASGIVLKHDGLDLFSDEGICTLCCQLVTCWLMNISQLLLS